MLRYPVPSRPLSAWARVAFSALVCAMATLATSSSASPTAVGKRRCEVAWLRMGRSKQAGKPPAVYAHLLTLGWAVGYKSLTLVKERTYTFVGTESQLLEIPHSPTEQGEKVQANFPTPSQKLFRAHILYAKVNLILSEVNETPQAFVRAFDVDKCMVQASSSECWILTIRAIQE